MRRFVVWPNELDARLSRRYGRAVSREFAVERPRIVEIIDAAKSLGIKIVDIDEEKLNPRLSGLDEEYRLRGMLRLESKHPKGKALRMIGQKIREIRKAQAKSKGRKKSKRKKR